MKRIRVQSLPRKKVDETPSQPMKAEYGGTYLLSQLRREAQTGES
jgi:hypothetical protein